ncbi:hypothetical protein LPB03_03230 [Polaribacter vadi]|jgi:hypothetical protein|uniref:AB hydrolase-1 domain-containing protein n=1 Tax=Polaribacter vadi TaxID=1774273 RepID=A0A1B8TY28_9FLAO|nr:alpha/beta fold hydrolase [Polaribacter vadi]AOW16538.1 hypothetical protein LPB03_03230 [Polaribacter vadi]OBY64557.1 hypothetical protein LPB3_09265 [Polaribacter vadi]|tara:strand:+ start:1079 stop:1984 length:906 start_codon:yes stop_codon:yes gene_type:complete
MTSTEWKSYGKFIKVKDNNLFVIDTGDDFSNKETLVIINGFPTTSYDYHKIIPLLSEFYRVVIHDHFGFGFSDLPDTYCYSLIDQANVCVELWKTLKLKRFTILSDGFGNNIGKEILYRKNSHLIPFDIKKLIICNSSNYEKYMDINTISALIKNNKLIKYKEIIMNYKEQLFYEGSNDYDKYKDKTKIKDIWTRFNSKQGQKDILVLCSYNEESFLYCHRWLHAVKETKIPVKIFWRKDNLENLKNILLHVASNTHNNVEIIENSKCFTLETNAIQWIMMVLKEMDKNVYNHLKTAQKTY